MADVKVEAWKIWQDYKVHLEKCLTPRSGFACCGVYGAGGEELSFPGTKLAPCRPESLAEHTDGVLHLTDAIARHLPEYMSPEEELKVMKILLWHDAGEIRIGDIPDDGNRDDARKDSEEAAVFTDITRRWPEPEREDARRNFVDFQKRNSPLTELAYCIDKLDAPLRALHYESRGCPGSIYDKVNMSNQDELFAGIAGSGKIADVWGLHVLELTVKMNGYDIVRWLLMEAFQDVRGSNLPQWLIDRLGENRISPH